MQNICCNGETYSGDYLDVISVHFFVTYQLSPNFTFNHRSSCLTNYSKTGFTTGGFVTRKLISGTYFIEQFLKDLSLTIFTYRLKTLEFNTVYCRNGHQLLVITSEVKTYGGI